MAQEHLVRLFLQHQDLLRDYLRGLVRDPHAAEDLFQELGVKVLSHAQPPEEPAAFLAWSRGVARNLLLHHWRGERRGKTVPGDAMLRAAELAFDEAHAASGPWAERRALLGDCLRHLPQHARGLVERHYGEGRPLAELAAGDGRSEAAVKMHLLRIRQQLRDCIQSKMKEAQG